uniref:Alpha-macroglobulin-like TED domain-containing protein n=1 Tax=Paramormyrops kingsleyae TaxID=1676925 RepID=A0A3B3QA62_9TELE
MCTTQKRPSGQLSNLCCVFCSVFWVTFPGTIQGGSEATVCAHVFSPNEPLSLTVALTHNDQKRTLFLKQMDQDFYECFLFQAPVVKVASHQSIEVEVQGASFQITKRSDVMFTPMSFLTFIRTDKPVYKQGQTGDPSPSLSLSLSLSFLHNRLTWKTFRWILVPSVIGSVNVTVRAEAVESQTVCDNEIVSVPEKGRVDTITRSLLVKAEGTEKTVSHGWLLCPQGALLHEEVMLQLPADVVEGSARATVSVIGDILGRALQNLDGMLAMPYGCGEQNMALLAPNIYILHYLRATQQLDPILLQKATHFLNTGYQRQLRYLHVNGAFSTFGHGTEVNSWLTAFVMRSLGSARSFMYVEPKVINGARTWLQSQQKKDGCFKTVGTLFNKRMKGGVMDDVTLTAYISASMLELNTSASVTKSLTCLREASHNLSDIYTTALLAYTFSLAQETDTSARLLKYLDSVASSDEGLLHWSPPSSEASTSLSVELTSYVLLAVLRRPQLSAADRGYTSRIAGWLVRQQNPQGGFFSTQDTVVALQALSRYATLVYSPGGASTVTVQSSGGDLHHFTVDQTNKLIYQERELRSIPGRCVIEAQGSACVSVQVGVIHVHPFHCFYSTDMVIADVAMLSGFVPEAENLKQVSWYQTSGEITTPGSN